MLTIDEVIADQKINLQILTLEANKAQAKLERKECPRTKATFDDYERARKVTRDTIAYLETIKNRNLVAP